MPHAAQYELVLSPHHGAILDMLFFVQERQRGERIPQRAADVLLHFFIHE